MNYKNDQPEHKYCLECGDEITFGRSDKKFCSQKCKNIHNNKIGYEGRRTRERVLNRIDTNHTILEGLIISGVSSISLIDLSQLGFSPEHVTGYCRTGCHDEFRCFDIKYFKSDTKIFHIEKVKIPMSK